MVRTSVIFKNPNEIDIVESPLPVPGEEEILVKTKFSAISAGTELLIFHGRFPSNLPVDSAIPSLARPFGYPLAYGYASVGQVVEIGPSVKTDVLGRSVFCFHPHESHFTIRWNEMILLPDDIDSVDAVLLAAMETAVNFLMDGRPVIGEIVVIFGLGIIGLLTTALLSQIPLGSLIVLDPFPLRREFAQMAGARNVSDPDMPDGPVQERVKLQTTAEKGGADLIYELSGNPAALNQALDIAGTGSRIVIGSWYGTKKAELDLGGRFHRNRIRLISSQVSTLASQFSDRWTKRRRLAVALDMIRRVRPGRFVTHRFDVRQTAKAFDILDKKPQEAVQVILTYE